MALTRTRLGKAVLTGFAMVTMLVSFFVVYGGCSGSEQMYYASETPAEADVVSVRKEAMYEAEVGVEAEPAVETEAPDVDPARTQRLVVYNAVMNVVVDRISDSLNRIKDAVEKMGGYMHQMAGDSITLKVPAARFNEAVAEVERLGEVAYRDIKGTDVTDEMRDLKIRLENAEQMRERLLKLLERAEKVEDMLKIENELARNTETIELLKGKIAHLSNSVAYCTLTVRFNSPVPQQSISTQTPFRWVHELASNMIRPVQERPYKSSSLWRTKLFDVPQSYIVYFQDDGETRAMSADNVTIVVRKQKNYKGGDVAFWSKVVRRVLVEEKVVNIKDEKELKVKGGAEGKILAGSKRIGSESFGYVVGLATNDKEVYVFEAWGPIDPFQTDRQKIEGAFKTVRVK